jgi:hypothetical protein
LALWRGSRTVLVPISPAFQNIPLSRKLILSDHYKKTHSIIGRDLRNVKKLVEEKSSG